MRRLAVAGVVLQVSTPAPAYDWYERLHNVDGDSCCHGKDCQPGDFCLLPGGPQGLDIPAIGYVGINWSKMLQVGSPDGRAHICMASPSELLQIG